MVDSNFVISIFLDFIFNILESNLFLQKSVVSSSGIACVFRLNFSSFCRFKPIFLNFDIIRSIVRSALSSRVVSCNQPNNFILGNNLLSPIHFLKHIETLDSNLLDCEGFVSLKVIIGYNSFD